MRVRIDVPAKVNLSLLVGPPRADGYHEVFTVLVPVALVDELDFDVKARQPWRAAAGAESAGALGGPPARIPGVDPPAAGALRVECAEAGGESNLVAKALRAVERATGWSLEGTVAVGKGIPVGAGLGGGSSDAAAALRVGAEAVVEAGGPALDDATLGGLGTQLGADVPFFLNPRPSLARGIGEELEPLALPALDIVLVFAPEGLATARVYRAFDAGGAAEESGSFSSRAGVAAARWNELARSWDTGGITRAEAVARVGDLLLNDLEAPSFDLVPSLVETKRVLLAEGAVGALMSGSGATVFGLCNSGDEAATLFGRLTERGFSARQVRTEWRPSVP